MIPLQCLLLEHQGDDYCEYGKRDDLLDHFQLHEVEGTTIAVETDSVGWDLCDVFEQGYAP